MILGRIDLHEKAASRLGRDACATEVPSVAFKGNLLSRRIAPIPVPA
jgi:hypothetical protein